MTVPLATKDLTTPQLKKMLSGIRRQIVKKHSVAIGAPGHPVFREAFGIAPVIYIPVTTTITSNFA